jgi:hypothetical protein
MREELDKKLCEKYPKIFADRHKSMTETAMCWGFECGDGWFTILDVLCGNIQWHIDESRKDRARAMQYNRVLKRALNGDSKGLEWYHTYGDTEKAIEWAKKTTARDIAEPRYEPVPEEVYQVVASQVKEKLGGLRFYVNGADKTVENYITMAHSMSYRMCEVCGSPGKLRGHGWYYTACDAHTRGEDLNDEGDEDADMDNNAD